MRINYQICAIVVLSLIVLLSAPLVAVGAPEDFCNVGNFRVPCEKDEFGGPAGEQSFGGLVTQIINILLFVVGSISVIFFMIGGFRYVTAHGNEEAAEGAKKTMTNAIIGLVVVIMSFAVIYIITQVLISGRSGIGAIE